eukprot:4696385-Alexandrium_andersonii.AAC.1
MARWALGGAWAQVLSLALPSEVSSAAPLEGAALRCRQRGKRSRATVEAPAAVLLGALVAELAGELAVEPEVLSAAALPGSGPGLGAVSPRGDAGSGAGASSSGHVAALTAWARRLPASSTA